MFSVNWLLFGTAAAVIHPRPSNVRSQWDLITMEITNDESAIQVRMEDPHSLREASKEFNRDELTMAGISTQMPITDVVPYLRQLDSDNEASIEESKGSLDLIFLESLPMVPDTELRFCMPVRNMDEERVRSAYFSQTDSIKYLTEQNQRKDQTIESLSQSMRSSKETLETAQRKYEDLKSEVTRLRAELDEQCAQNRGLSGQLCQFQTARVVDEESQSRTGIVNEQSVDHAALSEIQARFQIAEEEHSKRDELWDSLSLESICVSRTFDVIRDLQYSLSVDKSSNTLSKTAMSDDFNTVRITHPMTATGTHRIRFQIVKSARNDLFFGVVSDTHYHPGYFIRQQKSLAYCACDGHLYGNYAPESFTEPSQAGDTLEITVVFRRNRSESTVAFSKNGRCLGSRKLSEYCSLREPLYFAAGIRSSKDRIQIVD